ncbi:MAG: hypothetical protein KDA86_01290 [Planctomycetaceae bacterium]|nr:hypothetical protein [Planctomycetaceae bacterium]
MFDWLWRNTLLSISEEERSWIDYRFDWLIKEFGLDDLREITVVLPTIEFFPNTYDGSDADVQNILRIVCNTMTVDRTRVRLRFFDDNTYVDGINSGASGLYAKTRRKEEIWLSTRILEDPMKVVATLSHELAHAKLIGEKRIHPNNDQDHEKLTDLATVYFGMGIFTSNCVLRESYWNAGQMSGWQMERGGYLSMNEFGYALALFSLARNEPNAGWHCFLRRDVRASLKQGIRFKSQKANQIGQLP